MLREDSLGTESITKLLLKLTIPSMLAQFVNVFYSIADRIFIGNIDGIGDLALAGVGICTPVVTLLTSFSYLAGMGGAPLAAIRLGAGDKDGAKRILSNSFIMLLATAIILTIVFLCAKKPLLMLFGASENTYVYANNYLTIYLAGSVFAMLSLGLNTFITAQGFSKTAMASVLIGAALNIALDPLFIFVFNMGVKGAAIATVIAQFASFLWVILFLVGKKTFIRLSFKGFDFKLVKKILTLGISPFLIMATESVIIIVLNSVLSRTGGNDADRLIAAATIIISFLQLIIFPLGGLTMSAQPIMSFNLGAGKIERIRKGVKGLICICLIFNAIMFTLAMTIPQYFAKIFTDDSRITELAVWGIRVHTSGVLILTLQYAVVDSFTALNFPKYAITLSLGRKLGIILPLTIILPLCTGQAIYAFIAEPVADIIGGICSTFLFLYFNKKVLPKYGKLPINDRLISP